MKKVAILSALAALLIYCQRASASMIFLNQSLIDQTEIIVKAKVKDTKPAAIKCKHRPDLSMDVTFEPLVVYKGEVKEPFIYHQNQQCPADVLSSWDIYVTNYKAGEVYYLFTSYNSATGEYAPPIYRKDDPNKNQELLALLSKERPRNDLSKKKQGE